MLAVPCISKPVSPAAAASTQHPFPSKHTVAMAPIIGRRKVPITVAMAQRKPSFHLSPRLGWLNDRECVLMRCVLFVTRQEAGGRGGGESFLPGGVKHTTHTQHS